MQEFTWSTTEKKAAHAAFDLALARELNAIRQEVEAMLRYLSDRVIWRLHDYLDDKRREIDQKYDYRYSVLMLVFPRLVAEGWRQCSRPLKRRVFTIIVLFLALSGLAAASSVAQERPAPEASDFERLEAMLAFIRNRNSQDYAIRTPNGVDEGRYVRLGGIEQWITIRGEDRNNPVLLLLHGGPGDATNPWGYAGFRSWLKRFTVVQWDQRGAGRTLGRNGVSSAEAITIERMTEDGIELAEFLRQSLRKEKIVLVGHSWGSVLGVFIAKARPDLFWAFVGTGQVADQQRNYSVAYDALLRKAENSGEQRAIQELKAIGPPPYPDGRGYAVQRRWSNLFEGSDLFISSMFGLALGAPGYSLRDVNDWTQGQLLSSERLIPQMATLDSTSLGGEFELPVFVIQGAEDFTTPTSLAEEFVNSIRAPRKSFIRIEGGGHFVVFMKSDAFLQALLERVVPLGTLR